MDNTRFFISDFCQWARSVNMPAKSLSRLPQSLWRAVEVKLVADDESREIVVRQLIGSEELHCEFVANELWVYKSDSNWLEVGTIGPGWRRGWRNFDKDEHITSLLSDFFHFAGQYVHRGRAATITGAITAVYDKACDFRSGDINSKFGKLHQIESKRLSLAGASTKSKRPSSRLREFHIWANCINGLDPYVQRAVFQLWRAARLLSSGFTEEAITALDGLTTVAALFLQDRMSLPGQTRKQIANCLKLSEKDANNLEQLYQLRCDFGAHPSRSKWWDFAEIYDEDIDEMYKTTKKLLWQLCKAEHIHRVVEPTPPIWSEWFRENALMLFNSVWFKHIR